MVLKTQPATQLEEPMEELQDYAVWGGGWQLSPDFCSHQSLRNGVGVILSSPNQPGCMPVTERS